MLMMYLQMYTIFANTGKNVHVQLLCIRKKVYSEQIRLFITLMNVSLDNVW